MKFRELTCDGTDCTCPACGKSITLPRAGRAHHLCRAKAGLGDIVAAGLSAVGITPARVSAVLGVKDCGCKKRKAKLNELGRRLGIG